MPVASEVIVHLIGKTKTGYRRANENPGRAKRSPRRKSAKNEAPRLR